MTKEPSSKKLHYTITSFIFAITLTGSWFLFMNPPLVTKGDTEIIETTKKHSYEGDHILINLKEMTLTLHRSTTTVATYPLVSKGKPGSYYETMGGVYINDYKTPLHFSSIGHVYMPYSVHIFGNYFIHGIPYYPSGEKVSSTYSGGCIRLADKDMKEVYAFINKGTPIIITNDTEENFDPISTSTSTFQSTEMTLRMVASISLEALTQDNEIREVNGATTTRKNLLPRLLLENDYTVAELYAKSIGENAFIALMNQKAQALGLTNTRFNSVNSPVTTTYEDYMRFNAYIATYKSYLEKIRMESDSRPLR